MDEPPAVDEPLPEDVEQQLMEIAFGEELTATRREIFQKLGREFRDGERLFAEGDSSTDLYALLSGSVSVTARGPAGGQVELARLSAGELLGEMSHFDELPRSATATARGVTRTLVLSRQHFSLIFQLHPKWTNALVEGLALRIRRSLESAAGNPEPPAGV